MRLALLFGLFSLLVIGGLIVLLGEVGVLLGLFLCFWLGKGVPFHRQEVEALIVIAGLLGIIVGLLSGSFQMPDIAGAYY